MVMLQLACTISLKNFGYTSIALILKEVRVHEILHSVSPKINDCYSIYIQIGL